MVDDGLSELHDSRGSEAQTLDTIVEWARNAVEATEAGLFLLHTKNSVESVATTSTRVTRAHELQIELAEGPCLEVLTQDSVGTFLINDTRADRRFPAWGPRVADLGLRSVISAVLETRQQQFGSLNVYSTEPQAFDRDDLAVIDIFSHRAARAIAVAQDSANLTAALDTRKLVGQAQGILMERFGLDNDRAFAYLVRESQARNIKLRAIAEWIVVNRGTKPLSDLDQLE